MNREYWINRYDMIPHEEGGYYAEIWQAKNHNASHIYYLLPAGETAFWHRIKAEELWLFHSGGPLQITLGGQEDIPKAKENIIIDDQHIHCLIPVNTWQTAYAMEEDVLVSCVVSPGFANADWELFKEQDK
jgi:hypothetical protein